MPSLYWQWPVVVLLLRRIPLQHHQERQPQTLHRQLHPQLLSRVTPPNPLLRLKWQPRQQRLQSTPAS